MINVKLSEVDWWAGIVLLIGLFAFVIKCHIVFPIEYIGHADAAAYAEMADSIIHGRGLEVDYISFYFLKYDKKISRPEDHWPPLYSFLIVPFFLLFGKTAFAAKLPSLIISCFFFPLVGYFLGRRLSGSSFVGVAAGLNLLFYPIFFRHSLYCLSDITYAFMIALTVLFAIKGLDEGRFFYPMGVCMALSYYAKGSGLVLIPAYILFYLICRSNQNLRTDRQFLIGMGLCFLTLLPWFIRNTIHFQNPIFSTQNFASGFAGYMDWYKGIFKLYWGEKLPFFFDKFKHGFQFVYNITWKFLKQYLWWAFIDLRRTTGKFEAKDYYTYFTGIPAAIHLSMALIAGLYKTQVNLLRRIILQLRKHQKSCMRKQTISFLKKLSLIHRELWKILKRWHLSRLHIITLLGVFLFCFLSLCWMPGRRFVFPISFFIIIIGWISYYTLLRGLLRNLRHSKFLALGVMFLLLTAIVIHSIGKIKYDYKNSGYPYHDGAKKWMEAGRWIGKNLPGSVTMTDDRPWELHFYSEQKAIMTPVAPLERVIEVAKYYGVTHLIPEGRREHVLKPLLNGEIKGIKLKKIYDKGVRIYKIEF